MVERSVHIGEVTGPIPVEPTQSIAVIRKISKAIKSGD
ncbi:MAG: hypothetical protein Athens071426_115 [Parcubacteria group bacterium Athens0714_26]|nr:MAG: hypothetical protein Athens101426_665 [Parcubacteria group bacterium Athens1014_26]TSD03667.1 MAG: hypothetical protein Athens071426_115 [Parcubacteria group bacterium Athens0714_26]